jgi:hypothetical protein
MEVTEWSQRGSNYDNIRGVIIHNKFLRDVLSNVQGKMCLVSFFLQCPANLFSYQSNIGYL